jgi:iron complex transport system substrate-binding protein
MRRLMALLAAFTCHIAVARAEPPHRVASANLCADQLLIALADPDQIASLSPLSRDPAMSFYADRAARWPANRASGEDLVRAQADLVLIGPYDSRYTRQMLEMQHIPMQVLDPWSSLDDGRAQIRSLAQALGHPERGQALVASMDSSLSHLPHVASGRQPSFVSLHRRGFVHQAGLTSEILVRAGLRNAAADLGVGSYGFVRLETLVRNPPDFLVVDEGEVDPQDNGQAFLVHPALQRLFPPARRLVAPGQLTICGGPSTPALVDALTREINRKVLSPER